MSIKPRPTPTLKVRPGSPEELLTKTLAGAETLWRETQTESLILRTIKLLHENFRVEAAMAMLLDSSDQTPGLTFDPTVFFGEALLQELKQGLLAMDRQSVSDGVHRWESDLGPSVHFAVLGTPDQGGMVLLWKERQNTGDGSEQGADVAIDFLIRQLQSTFRWFCRFSETQTLLHIDDLTGLYNLRYLEISIDREIKRSQRYGSCFSVLFIDLDRFKPVNDTYGHLVGSQVLRDVAGIIRGCVRDVDLVFRYGGDEFVVLLIEADAATGYRSAQRIRERIEQTHFAVGKGATAQVTTSIGVAAFPEHAKEKERLLALADECMYESKRQGKNQVVLASQPPIEEQSRKDPEQWSRK